MLLDGKVAIVSGVGPGLGQANAKALAREGAKVVLAARSRDFLELTADEIIAAGGEAIVVPTDIADESQARALPEAAVEQWGRLDILVNNAFRMSRQQPFEVTDIAKWRGIFDVNVFGALTLTQAAIPHLRKAVLDHGDGAIVFISSLSSRKMTLPDIDYTASKGAINAVVRALATELGPARVRVNAVLPGWIGGPNVEMFIEWQAQERGVPMEDVRSEIESRTALRLIPPQDDIANSVVFLASPWARVITGVLLDVNGGEWMPQ
jgi:NAD(P)-dependent dehydrogenase (short-subunit alcohol dehydrogenase family)